MPIALLDRKNKSNRILSKLQSQFDSIAENSAVPEIASAAVYKMEDPLKEPGVDRERSGLIENPLQGRDGSQIKEEFSVKLSGIEAACNQSVSESLEDP